MLKVIIGYENSDIISFIVKGHAGYAPHGQDICCAGVSAVTQTALIGLMKHLEAKPDYRVEKGDLEVFLPENLSREDNDKAQLILSTMVAGLESMQETYREFIEIDTRRC